MPRQIFNPGGIEVMDPDDQLLCMEMVAACSSWKGYREAVFCEGQFTVNGRGARLTEVLFDTGALHRSYISRQIVEKQEQTGRVEWSPAKPG